MNTFTYIQNLYLNEIQNTFSTNRKNAISEYGVTHNGANHYIEYDNINKVHTAHSSPYPFTQSGIDYVYVKTNNATKYNFYKSFSYTYTENITGNDVDSIILAYDYVHDVIADDNTFTLSAKLNHGAEILNGIPQNVNIYSWHSYCIEDADMNESDNKIFNDELSLSGSDIKQLLNGKSYLDCSSYVVFSYIQQNTPRDGIIHTDGKQRITNDRYKDFHVWSFIDGFNSIPYSYNSLTDNTKVNAYTYLAIGNNLKNYFENVLSAPINMIKLSYDLERESLGTWTAGISENMTYVKETNQNYTDFYTRAKSYDLSIHTDESFADVCNHPSFRNNNATCYFYENIKGTSNGDINNTIQQNIDTQNYNIGKFVKKIGGLPIAIAYETLYFTNPLVTNSAGFNVPANIPLNLYNTISPKVNFTFYKGVKGNRIYPTEYSSFDCYELVLSQLDKIYIQYTPIIEIEVTHNQTSGSHISFIDLSRNGCNNPNKPDYIEFSRYNNTDGIDFFQYTRNWLYPDGYNINKYNIYGKVYFLKFKDAFVDGIYNVSFVESISDTINESTNQGTGQAVSFSFNVGGYDGYCSTLHIATNERLFVNTGTPASPVWKIVRSGDMPFNVDSNVNTQTDTQIRYIDSSISVSTEA